jgi:hypothetical protein
MRPCGSRRSGHFIALTLFSETCGKRYADFLFVRPLPAKSLLAKVGLPPRANLARVNS